MCIKFENDQTNITDPVKREDIYVHHTQLRDIMILL